MNDERESTPKLTEATQRMLQLGAKAADDVQMTPIQAQRIQTVLLSQILATLEQISDQLASQQKSP